MKKNKAYTLAEVLITMAIVGAIAAMTIPNINNSTRLKEREARFKTIYSKIENALQASDKIYACYYIPNEDEIENNFYGLQNKNIKGGEITSDCERFYKNLVLNMGGGKNCSGSCMPSNYLKDSENKNDCFESVSSSYMLKDGSYIIKSSKKPSSFIVDVNGKQGPNKYGQDVYILASIVTNASTVENGKDDKGEKIYKVLPTRVEIFPSSACDFPQNDSKSTYSAFKNMINLK